MADAVSELPVVWLTVGNGYIADEEAMADVETTVPVKLGDTEVPPVDKMVTVAFDSGYGGEEEPAA